ncbi:MAG: ribose 5-phosphate isomerase A [Nitrososphaerota archaeon]|nr:ribose 5-phosphate isomerase A [Candidatus Bathyarchaeota archaeon]MDW8023183.1 ribose 5-phosphate isomerase A [Nitrososphaerota archaeon]
MKRESEWVEKAKRNAALEAVKHVKDGFVIGLGSGSTVAYAAEEIGKRIKLESLCVKVVPTSYQAFMLAVKHGIPTTTLDENPKIDLTIDGADQIDEKLNLIKGMGGALTREKIVAHASKSLIIIADERKKAKTLGENGQPVPVEVLPFAAHPITLKIRELGGKPQIREGAGKVGPVITDNGNFIIDVNFGLIENPAELERRLRTIPGVVETGLFVGLADVVYLGKNSGVEKLERRK